MLAALPKVLMAQRGLNRARRLRSSGDLPSAFASAMGAFALLHEAGALEGSPQAAAVLATESAFLDELSAQLGCPAAAAEDVAGALRVLDALYPGGEGATAVVKQFQEWYRYRAHQLASTPKPQVQ
jgi:hypothetical protein